MKIFRILFLLVFVASSLSLFSQGEKSKDDIKLEKKNKRIMKRFVHPKSIFFQLSTGVTVNYMKFSEDNEFFERRLGLGSNTNYTAKIEVGTKDNYFYEIGSSFRQYKYAYSFIPFPYFSGHPPDFHILKIYGGYGKRIVLKKTNLNIINIQAGISLSYNFDHSLELLYSPLGSSNPSIFDMGNGYYARQFGATSSHKVYPTLYIAINKDVRIVRDLYLSLNYRYDQGLITSFSQKIEYFHISNPSEVTTLHNHFRGTAHSFSVGLKYRFLAKKYRNN